jgi:uracil-DNA glycosylase
LRIKGWDLKFFDSGEWQVCNERLKDLEKVSHRIHTIEHNPGDGYSPGRKSLFRALRSTPAGAVRCAIIGQDPYPDRKYATGLAFSIPGEIPQRDWPPTLRTFLGEYSSDLGLPLPSNGSLERWTKDGVLLWNAIPSCRTSESLSHDWDEWSYLTREIIHTLAEKGIVFALLGQVARRYFNDINPSNNVVVVSSHPSPRGSQNSRTPFIGSRIFSTINDRLNDQGLQTIDWKLP